MRYYKLLYDYEHDKDFVFCNIGNVYGTSEYAVNSGRQVEDWNRNINLIYDRDEGSIMTDYLSNILGWPIISGRFQNLAENLIGDKVQYLPIRIIDKSTMGVINTYKVLNIINVVDALDLENSIFDTFDLNDEKVIMVSKYALKADKVDGQHIFRLKNEIVPVFVSEDIKNIILKNGLLGFAFTEVKAV